MPEQLAVGLPKQNLTILSLARKLSANVARPLFPPKMDQVSWAESQREQLKRVIRYTAVSVEDAWRINSTKNRGLESLSYRLDFSNGLSATGIWLNAISAPQAGSVTIVLNDEGYKGAAEDVSQSVNRGEQVLALDLVFNGATAPENPADWEMLVSATGDRPLGLEVAQLLAAAAWVRTSVGPTNVQILTQGIRSQVIAVTAAALDPRAFSNVKSRQSIVSLGYLLSKPVPFRSAPELFCLDLYKFFDIDLLEMLGVPTETGFRARERSSK